MPDRIRDVFEAIAKRRTVRKFTDTPVPEEDLMKILDAARMAPSSGNQQAWRFLVIRDPDRIARIKRVGIDETRKAIRVHPDIPNDKKEEAIANTEAYLEGIFAAPVLIAVLGDRETTYPDYLRHDLPLAAANLMLAARALGYGTMYGTDFVPLTAQRAAMEIPDRYEIACTIALGVPASWPEPPEKKDLESLIVRERFV
jgi:nitroreductase